MSLLLAPYNNAMRLGQGFNSYTHEICIDDAVIVSPQQPENVLTNDGNTMRLTALILGKPSAWTKQDQVLLDTTTLDTARQSRQQIEAEKASGDAALLEAAEAEAAAAAAAQAQQEHIDQLAAQAGASISTTTTDSPPPPAAAASTEVDIAPAPVEQGSSGSEAPQPATEAAAEPVNESTPSSAAAGAEAEGGASAESGLAAGAAETPKEDSSEGTSEQTPPAAAGDDLSTNVKSDGADQASSESADHSSEWVRPSGQAKVTDDDASPSGAKSVAAEDSVETGAPQTSAAEEPVSKDDTASTATDATHEPSAEAKYVGTGPVEVPSHQIEAAVKTPVPAKTKEDLAAEEKQRLADEAAKQRAAQVAALQLKRKQEQVRLANQRRERDPDMLAAANRFKVNLSLEKMAEMHREFLLPKSTHKDPNVGKKTQVFSIQNSTGVSQTVVFQSRFVDKLSDVTSDLGVSASLSIKKGSCGGSGRGSFIDTDKFKSSDLNYYISVKVVNQSINFKDALEFNNLENIGEEDFRSVFGDCFISGFLEGGELNALVSMKILNTAKSTDIKAEGAIALGKGSLDISAKGAFETAKTNLDLNTETTIQVSWIGGGVIKPPEEAWTVESLARAATRFPDHVAQSPQRTYAILTKYDNLRSYQALKPPEVTPIDYENATLYTNELMDTFMSYKAIYGRLTSQINEVQGNTLKFKKVEGEAERKKAQEEELSDVDETRTLESLSTAEKQAKLGFFPSTIDGLDDARRAVRGQMNLIIERVDQITKDPSKVLDSPKEKFLPFFAFEALLPMLESAFRTNKRTAPLTGEKMFGDQAKDDAPSTTVGRMCIIKKPAEPAQTAKKDSTTAAKDKDKKDATSAVVPNKRDIVLLAAETEVIDRFLAAREDGVEASLRLTAPLGNELAVPTPGNLFTALDFVQPSFLIRSVAITVTEGVVTGLSCKYTNGLSWKRGLNNPKDAHELKLAADERITSVIITVGTEAVIKSPEFILAIKLITNRGNSKLAHEPNVRRAGFSRRFIGNRAFSNVRAVTWESPLDRGYVSGFWGWSAEKGSSPGIFRLGLVWANQNAVDQSKIDDAKKAAARDADAAHEETVGKEEILARNLEISEDKLSKANELFKALQRQNEANTAAAQLLTDEKLTAQARVRETEQKIRELEDMLASVKTSADSTATTLREEAASTKQDLQRQLEDARRDADNARQSHAIELGQVRREAQEAQQSASELTRRREELQTQLNRARANDDTFILKHWRGKVLDHHPGVREATIYQQHGQWNQTWRTERAGAGFKVYNQEDNGQRWYLLVTEERYNWPDCKKVKLSQNDGSIFTFEPSGYGESRWFRLRMSHDWNWHLNPWNGLNDNEARVIAYSGGMSDNDNWQFA